MTIRCDIANCNEEAEHREYKIGWRYWKSDLCNKHYKLFLKEIGTIEIEILSRYGFNTYYELS